jgi:beta-lactamase superfamily II metal-dependent hydrolase
MEVGDLTELYSLRIEALPASYGDCLLVVAPTQRGDFRILIDTGRNAIGLKLLKARLRAFPIADGVRRIDLFVITHIDSDHIANAAALLSDESLQIKFGDIWFNGLAEVRSTGQADEVSAVLKAKGLSTNRAFGHRPAVVSDRKRWQDIYVHDDLTVTLLSPRPAQLASLREIWPLATARLAAGEPDSIQDMQRTGPRAPIDLRDLAAAAYQPDSGIPNGSSIGFLLEHNGVSVLLPGDAHAEVYGPALGALLASRREGQNRIDAVKLSHHGSRRNTTDQLTLARARHYIVSSSGALYGHPDDETIARLVVNQLPNAMPTFWFNYATQLNERWAEVAKREGTFQTRFPVMSDCGVVLVL